MPPRKKPRRCPSGFRWNDKKQKCVKIPKGEPGYVQGATASQPKPPDRGSVESGGGGSGGSSEGGGSKKPLGGVTDDAPIPFDDGREYRHRDGMLQANINGKWYPVSDQFREGDDVRLAPRSRDAVMDLQIQLTEGGYLSPTMLDREAGTWGEKSREAFRDLLKDANFAGEANWRNVLEFRRQEGSAAGGSDGGGGGGGGGGGSGGELALSHPMEVKALANDVARSIWGRKLNPQEEESFVASFHQMESSGQPVSPQVWAEGALKMMNPQEAAGAEVRGFVDEWNNLLASSKPGVSGGPFQGG